MRDLIPYFLFSIIVFNITLFYLDDFKLSNNKYIKFSQILTPILLIFILVILIYTDVLTFNAISGLNENKNTSNTINIGANVEVNRNAAEAVGRNIGIAGTVAGVSGAVAKGIAKSSMPPLQKAAVILGSSIAGGAIFVGTSAVNRVINHDSTIISSNISTNSNLSDNVNKLLGNSDNNLSDLILLIISTNTLISVSLSLIFILFIMILFKFYLNENQIKLNYSRLIGEKLNENFNYYIIKIIQLNKKTSTIYIFVIFAILFVSLSFSIYFMTELYNNLDKFIDLHLNSKK
jgi:hypothetical protein